MGVTEPQILRNDRQKLKTQLFCKGDPIYRDEGEGLDFSCSVNNQRFDDIASDAHTQYEAVRKKVARMSYFSSQRY